MECVTDDLLVYERTTLLDGVYCFGIPYFIMKTTFTYLMALSGSDCRLSTFYPIHQ